MRSSWGARILRVVDHIQEHALDELEPEALAKIAGMSLHHFHRVFRGLVGESVMGFVRRLRLERAAQRLRFDDTPVTEVAFDAGYGSHEAFTRAFRARFGESPSAYRRHSRTEIEPPEVVFRELPEQVAVAVRHVGCYDQCGAAWATLRTRREASPRPWVPITSLGLCYDDPEITATARLRYDACEVIDPRDLPEPLPEDCARRVIPGGRYAIATHRGPLETLFETYLGLIGRYLPFSNLELANEPVVEFYLKDPKHTAPADLVTEVCVRVQ
ncbi:MAG: AraC family transcriptional regulator [Proteobacteria bacterium]|nr:MAG: AraC family transcriptional regulator [Pseudomonadota bacterium]